MAEVNNVDSALSSDCPAMKTSKGRQALQKLRALLSSLFGLILLLILYTVIGALIFQAIESPTSGERTNNRNNTDMRENLLDKIYNLSHILDTRNETELWRNLTRQYIKEYEISVYGKVTDPDDDYEVNRLTFGKAVIFCGTLYTTVGYGHIVPFTDLGKIMTIMYASIGIPLTFYIIFLLGRKLTLILIMVWNLGIRCPLLLTKSRKSYSGQVELLPDNAIISKKAANKLFFVGLIISIAYLLLGALLYTVWESDWDFIQGLYVAFISVSTIGFGDVLHTELKYFFVSLIYVFVGLSLVSMCFHASIQLNKTATTYEKMKEETLQSMSETSFDS